MRNVLLLIGLLIALSCVLLLGGHTVLDHDSTGTPPEGNGEMGDLPPELQGRPVSRTTAADEELTGWTLDAEYGPLQIWGVVREAGGDPIEDAVVYLVEKGEDRGSPIETAPTDDRGAWFLFEATTAGCWLAAMADGYFRGFVDGDTVRPGEPVTFELTPGIVTTVVVRCPAGQFPSRGEVRVTTTGHNHVYGGPADAPYEECRVPLFPDGVAYPRIGTRRAVAVSVIQHRCLIEPEKVVLDEPGGVVEFTLVPTCTINVRAIDAVSGDPLSVGFDVALLRDGKPVPGGGSSSGGRVYRILEGLATGDYAVTVRAPGYLEAAAHHIVLAQPGQQGEVTVELVPDARPGSIVLVAPALPRLGLSVRDTHVLWRSRRSSQSKWHFTSVSGYRGVCQVLLTNREPGEYDVLIRAPNAMVAIAPRIPIHPGKSTTRVLALEPGLFVDLDAHLPPDTKIRRVSIRSPAYGDLPVYYRNTIESPPESDAVWPLPRTRLGPYPGPSVHVKVLATDGITHAFTVEMPEDEEDAGNPDLPR